MAHSLTGLRHRTVRHRTVRRHERASAKGRPRSSDDLAEAARDVDRVLLARQCI